MMCRVRLEEYYNMKLMPSKAKLEKFFEKKGPKIHCLSLKLYAGPPNCITGASESRGWGPEPPGPPLDPLVQII